MKTTIIAIVFLLIGAAVGGYLALGVGAGMGAGAGIVVGSQAGACLAVEAAKDLGLLTAEQVNEVLNGAVAKIADGAKFPPEAKLIGGEADCAKVVADLKNGVQSQQK
jgi:hypothetical protein